MHRSAKVAAVVGVLAGCSANDDTPAPQISAVSPDHAAPASIVVISGSYFCHQRANEDPLFCMNMGNVEFGTSVGVVTQYTDTSIMVEVPSVTGSVRLVVEVAGETSNAVTFTID